MTARMTPRNERHKVFLYIVHCEPQRGEAIQQQAYVYKRFLDCFVAALLAMTIFYELIEMPIAKTESLCAITHRPHYVTLAY